VYRLVDKYYEVKYVIILEFLTNFFRSIFGVEFSMYKDTLSPIPFTENNERTREFAQVLLTFNDEDDTNKDIAILPKDDSSIIENMFESLTYANTYVGENDEDNDLLLQHIDFQNCHEAGFNAVFVVYFYVQDPKDE